MTAVISASVEYEVPFQDLDPMNVVWHGNYFRYFEAARAALLRRMDYDYPQMQESGYLWPIVDTRVKYVRPARYRQLLSITANLVEWENRLRIDYEIVDAENRERITTGFTIQCAVDGATGELQLVTPDALRDRIRRLS